MAYYLTVKEKQDYKLLDVTCMEEFRRISKFKNNSYSLEEINMFSSQFDNELSLKIKLFEQGIITLEDIVKDITIRLKLDGKLKKVPYGLAYKHMIKYFDIHYLRMKLLELQNDTIFLNKLLDYYRNNHNQEALRQINALLHGYRDTDLNIYSALNLFFSNEIFKIDRNTGLAEIKYKSLHDLAMFIYNYIDKKDKSNIELESRKIRRIEELKSLKESLTPKEIIVKKRVKKQREEIDGQISFF